MAKNYSAGTLVDDVNCPYCKNVPQKNRVPHSKSGRKACAKRYNKPKKKHPRNNKRR